MKEENDYQGMEELNKLVLSIIDECKHIQSTVGRGLYASVYQKLLYQALLQRGMFVQRQVPVYAPQEYQEVQVDMKAELVVENSVICDIKCVDTILPMHKKALATFLRLSNKPVGLLVNFKEPNLRQ